MTAAGLLLRAAVTLLGIQSDPSPQAARPQFEAASIRPDPSPRLRHVLLPPIGGRLSTRAASLRLLIQSAYRVQSFQIYGGPDWMNSAGYDIEAKGEGNPSRSQVWLMLQSLLEERFQLRVHREMKTMPVYTLAPAKAGLRLMKPKEGSCIDPGAMEPALGSGLLPCGDASVAFESAKGLFILGGQVTIAELVRELSNILQRPIIDKTGFAGKFDVNLRFAYEEDVTVGIAKPPTSAEFDGDSSLIGALQRELGLKLESAKGPVEVLVVDRAERPSAN